MDLKFDYLNRNDFKAYAEKKPYLKLRDKVKNIAIYKGGGGLGDLVVGVGLFKLFRQYFPEAKISYMGTIYPWLEKIFKSIPYIDGYIPFERPNKGKGLKRYFRARQELKGSIDLLVDTQRRWETSFWLRCLNPRYMLSASPFLSNWPMPYLNYKKMHVSEQMFSLPARLGIRDLTEYWQSSLNIPEENKKNAHKYITDDRRKVAVLMPSCGMAFKNWPPEYFAKIGDLFANRGYMIIILGSPKDKGIFEEIRGLMRHRSAVPALEDDAFANDLLNGAAILERASVAVGNDSGGMHLASCLGVLSATIFGPTTPRKFSPVGRRNIIFYDQMVCSPCRFKCPRKIYRECLVKITPEQVFDECMKRMQEGA